MMREPTEKEVAKFKRACKALNELGKEGFRLYLADDTMNLMIAAPHSHSGMKQSEHVRESCHISGASGGDW